MVGKVVLLVDDEPDILESMELVLLRDLPEVPVVTARSGAQALEIIRSRDVGVVVTDYKMPGMDGLALTREIRKLRPEMPIMMMTAYPDPSLATKAVTEYGVGLMVAKPFDIDFLVGTIQSMLAGGPPPVRA